MRGRRLGTPLLGYLAVALWTTLTHGLLLINDGIYWDGWIIHSFLAEKDWGALYHLYDQYGSPWQAWQHWSMLILPSFKITYRLVEFGGLVVFALVLFAILNETKIVSPLERFWITLLTISYPAFQILVSQVTATNLGLSNPLLLLAVLAALRAEKFVGKAHIGWRILALLLFVFCFMGMDYYLAFYFGFLLFLVLYARWQHNMSLKGLLTYVVHRLDYVLLPFVYWFLRRSLFPQQGDYATHYKIGVGSASFFAAYLGFAQFILNQLGDWLTRLLSAPAFWFVLMGGIFAWLYWLFQSSQKHNPVSATVRPYSILLFGMALLVLAIFPFAAAEGRVPKLLSYDIRHAILLPLPLALILVGGMRLIFPTKSDRPLSIIAAIVLTITLLGMTHATITDYLQWQARWAKDRAVITYLDTLPAAQKYTLFWVRDEFLAEEDYYRFYEWAGMFKVVWGNEKRAGMNETQLVGAFQNDIGKALAYLRPFATHAYLLADWDPAGCQARLIVRRADWTGSDVAIAGRYFYYKYLLPDKMNDYLSRLVSVQVEPLSPQPAQASNCRR
ncbi:MAG: hypothetical protein HPY45_07435 [Anaerolineae bacterium]|nr:hypothetical protein [Anaerolineae bacterium]